MNDSSNPNRYSLTDQVMALVAAYTKTIFVPADRFTIAQMPVPMVTKLRDVKFEIDKTNCDGCLDFTFATMEPHRTDGMHAFTFVPNISAAQARKSVLTTYDSEPYPWPAELLDINFIFDDSYPATTVSIKPSPTNIAIGSAGRAQRASVYVQRAYRDAVTAQTWTRYKFYLSNTPFPAGDFDTPQPHPTEIFWDFGTSSGRLLCLHDDVTIDAQYLTYAALYGTAYGSQGNSVLPAQLFPRTNFKKRTPFDEITCPPTPTKGLFIRVAKRRYPPHPGPITSITR